MLVQIGQFWVNPAHITYLWRGASPDTTRIFFLAASSDSTELTVDMTPDAIARILNEFEAEHMGPLHIRLEEPDLPNFGAESEQEPA